MRLSLPGRAAHTLRRLRITALFVTAACAAAGAAHANADPELLMLLPEAASHDVQASGDDVQAAPRDDVQASPHHDPRAITSGALDASFMPFDYRTARRRGGVFWVKLSFSEGAIANSPSAVADPPAAIADPPATAGGLPALLVRQGRHLQLQVFDEPGAAPLARATALPSFSGLQEAVYVLPRRPAAADRVGQASGPLYVRVEPAGRGAEQLLFSRSTLDEALARGSEQARMIALAFGALMALAIGSLLIWFVLSDRLFVLYAALFGLQALYVAYLSGQGFDWPVLAYAAPLMSHAWNVPAALSGAAACLFVREIADLRRFAPRSYRVFGWFAIAFVVLAFANLGDLIGLGALVAMIGNLVFVGAAVFTLVAAFMAWRRGSRAAGWFLIAWTLLEAFTIATAIRLLVAEAEGAELLLYYGLPMSMVVAAAFVALGVADRLREQRVALTEAERRAQTDPLTGALNRRSIVERLEAACTRAQARGLPISLLFIDLDHFKEINDTFGHAAGDACLHAIIKPIQAELRQSDVVGRYGGEEFVVILSSADVSAARPIAERIRERVAETSVEGFGAPIQLTCSIGVATSDMLGVWGEKLIARADAAVYAAKKSGRNRVQVAAPLAA
jgi:two-component system, sensor histidine kinase LadS